MAKKSLDGEQKRFEFRPGMLNMPGFRGMNKTVEPSNIPPYQFQHLENVRLSGGQVKCRGGQHKLSQSTVTGGCVWGIFPGEYQFQGFGSGFASPTGTNASDPTEIGSRVLNIDPDATPNGVINFLDGGADYNLRNMTAYGTKAYFLSLESDGTYTLRRYRGMHATPNIALDLGTRQINHFTVLGSTMYFVGTGSTTDLDTKVYTWDGSSSTVTLQHDFAEELPFPKLGIRTASSQVLLVAGDGSDASERFFVLTSGTWTEPTIPAGLTGLYIYDIKEFGTTTYLCGISLVEPIFLGGNSGRVMSWDGSTYALERSLNILIGSDPNGSATGMTVFDSKLYVCWGSSGSPGMIAKFTGAAWTDAEKTFPVDTVRGGYSLFHTLTNLYILAEEVVDGNLAVGVHESDGLSVSGTFTEIFTGQEDLTAAAWTISNFGLSIFPMVDITNTIVEYA